MKYTTSTAVPLSGKELRKLFYDAGYELVPGGGKGVIGN